jgi:hypothetical protein
MNPDVLKRELTLFHGSQPRLDPESIPATAALLSQNVAYLRGQVSTRYGHSVVFTPSEAATAMANWVFLYLGTPENVLLYLKQGTGVRYMDLSNLGIGPFAVVAQTTAQGASFATAGSRIFIGFYDANGVGLGSGQVYSWTGGVDPLFAAPTQILISGASEPSAGAVTAGLHRFGFLLQTRNGFTTTWCPVTSGGAFSPFSFTASGGKNLRVTINGGGATWPAYSSQVQLIMTTAANLNRYFIVPGTTTSVAPGTNFSYTLPDFSISDSDLTATATDAVTYQNRLAGDQSGNPPFSPSVIFAYGSRMVYVTRDAAGLPVAYCSNANDLQALYAATSGVYLPGNLQIITGFALRGVAYLVGPHWTFAVADNGSTPSQWASPQLVDGSIGTLAPQGVWVNEAQGYAWVADEGGLYLFQGAAFPARPISYYQQPDWALINWAAPTAIQVIDDKNNKRVEVLAPLNGSLTPTHRLTWDYTEGTDPETAKYSIQNLTSYAMGAMGLVQNPTTKRMELWLAPSSAGAFLRQNDGSEANPYRDVNTAGTTPAAIAGLYETALLPGIDYPGRGQVHYHHGDHLRIRGSGNLALKVWGIDHVRSVVPAASPIALAGGPGLEYLFKYFLLSEYASLQLSTNAVDAFFTLSGIKHYFTPASPQR